MNNSKNKKTAMIISLISFVAIIFGYYEQKQLYLNDYYAYAKEDRLYSAAQEQVRSDAYALMEFVISEDNTIWVNDYEALKTQNSNLRYKMEDYEGKIVASNTEDFFADSLSWDYQISFVVKEYYGKHIETYMDYTTNENNSYSFYAFIDEDFPVHDAYYEIYKEINHGYLLRDWIHLFIIASIVAGILSLAFLSELFHKKIEDDEEANNKNYKTLFIIGILSIITYLIIESKNYAWIECETDLYTFIIHPLLSFLLVLTLYCIKQQMNSSDGMEKAKKYYYVGLEKCKKTFAKLSLVKRAAILVLGITLFEFFSIQLAWNNMGLYLFIWIIEKIILLPIVFVILFDLRKIKIAGEEFASGNLDYKLNTENMSWDFKKHAENMNSIADGLNLAVEKRLQSERMKTELITNVSHDIKTPITSIINYAGLIEKEECNSPKHKEYAEVLVRKSVHLKRLLDDLVEASKASTGNLEMQMEVCKANVLLTQVVGEFEQRFEEAKLQLLTKAPEEDIRINVDSRRIWRVFENLLINACKYSLEGSRVYINLEQVGEEAVFIFRNTSKTMLNVTSEELMERFVRGDSSRSTEGNGLGLSIAKSLTELQNGTMDILIDGDLFKVILKFPIVKEQWLPQ